MKTTRLQRLAIGGVLAMFVLAGCASGESDPGEEPESEPTTEETADEGGETEAEEEPAADDEQASGPFQIGTTEPLTGEAAVAGEWAQRGAEIAADHVLEEYGIELEFLWEDTQLDPQTTVAATEQLISDGIQVIMTQGSSVSLAQAPIATREEVPIINTGGQTPALAGASPYLFNALPTSRGELEQLADIAVDEMGLETFAMLVVDADLGQGDVDAFSEILDEKGAEVVAVETFPVGARDMRTALTRIRNEAPDALYIIGNLDEVGAAISQTAELGIEAQLLGRTQNISPAVLEAAGEAANGMVGVGTVFRPSEDNEIGQRFLEEHQERFGEEPSVYTAINYDAVRMIADAIAAVGYDAQAITDHLAGLSGFSGAMGDITIDDTNTASYGLFAYRVEGGEAVPFDQ